MRIDIQRLRNLTTHILHTDISHVYEDLERITREKGIMTHMLPSVNNAVEPWLREKVTDERFWDGQYDPTHTGEIELPEMTDEERNAVFERFANMPSIFGAI
jgi:hypothetical protein